MSRHNVICSTADRSRVGMCAVQKQMSNAMNNVKNLQSEAPLIANADEGRGLKHQTVHD